MPVDPTAAPARDWNERISADCYRPNAELGNFGAMSWNLGPTLAGWLQAGDPVAYRGFVDGDRGANGMAQPFHHAIMPLASAADRLTEVRWGLRDFEVRFGRRPTGMWLPETAVDMATLRLLAEHGITHTVLAPWQVTGSTAGSSTRAVRSASTWATAGRSSAVLYDGLLSAAVSFDPAATVDADSVRARAGRATALAGATPRGRAADRGHRHGRGAVRPPPAAARPVPLAARRPRGTAPDLPFATPALAVAVEQAAAEGLPAATLRDRTSWSCHHGIARWGASCECVPDGTWKGPLRSALDRLAGGVDAGTEHLLRVTARSPGSVGGARRVRRRAARRRDGRVVHERAPGARRHGRRPRDVRRGHGRPALAPRDVRELWLVLGGPGADRDAPRRCGPPSAPPG